jgi:hypothetical protein
MDEFDMKKLPLINKLEGYHILNSIKPTYFQTKFPYDKITANKIIFTKRKIEILAAEYESFKNNRDGKNGKNNKDGKNTKDGKNNKDGKNTKDGKNNKDGKNTIGGNCNAALTVFYG